MEDVDSEDRVGADNGSTTAAVDGMEEDVPVLAEAAVAEEVNVDAVPADDAELECCGPCGCCCCRCCC